jgi:mannose-1-phosphate guanylyltransferase
VGHPTALMRANLRWLARSGLSAWSSPDAELASGVRLERSLVGSGARVEGAGAITESVIFPGAQVSAPCEAMLVSKSCRVALRG